MQFLHPLFFLLSIFIAAVILFYFFRKQYTEKPVSSNFLWEQVLNEWQASPWLKKLQKNLLFWLQLLALILLMFSLVRPLWFEDGVKGDHIIMIIDPSATMSAKFDTTTRFEKAKEEMSHLVDQLHGQGVTLIAAGKKPEILLSHESDSTVIKKKINSLQLTYDHEQMDKAMNIAFSLASGNDTSIHIFSDGVTMSQVIEAMGDQYVEVHNIGEKISNASVISFGVALVENQITGVAVVENQTDEKMVMDFIVKSEEEILFKKKLSIEAKEQDVVNIPALPKKPYYEAIISDEDGYTADNHLTAIYSEVNPNIYSVGDVNSFAIKGFQTIGANLLQTNDDQLSQQSAKGVFLTEGSTLTNIPKGPIIFFNIGSEKTKLIEPLKAKENDRLLQYVDYEKIYIDSAAKEIDGEWETILNSGNIPLIQKGQVNGQPIIMINFSLTESDWPLQPSFPIFLYNSYEWLSQQTDFIGYFSPGEEKWLNLSGSKQSWEIFNKQDKNLYSLDLTKESFKAPKEPGTYQAVSGDKVYYFSVLLDDQEKHPIVEAAFKINEQQNAEKGKMKIQNDKLWFWLALLALVFIALEWEVYRKWA